VHEPAQLVGASLGTAQSHRPRSVKLARIIADLAGCEHLIVNVEITMIPPLIEESPDQLLVFCCSHCEALPSEV
jgi:hypothetical protein